jgi:hypothetical protein
MTLSGKDILVALKGLPGMLLLLILIFCLSGFDLFSHLMTLLSCIMPKDFLYAVKGLLKLVY